MITSAKINFYARPPFSRQRYMTQHPCLLVPISLQKAVHASNTNWVYFMFKSELGKSMSEGYSLDLNAVKKVWITWFEFTSVLIESISTFSSFMSVKHAFSKTAILFAITSTRVCIALVPCTDFEIAATLVWTEFTMVCKLLGEDTSIIFWHK